MHYNIKNILSSGNCWNSDTSTPIYQNLYNALKKVITEKMIPADIKLPPSRILSKDLKISRSSVIKAYELLSLENYIVSRQGSGYYIVPDKRQTNASPKKIQSNIYGFPAISKRAKSFQKNQYLSTDNFSKKNIAFRPGLPPLDIFPIKKWKNITNNYWAHSKPTYLSYAPPEGLDILRIRIANYLKIYRNIDCNYQQIIITSGSLHSLYLIGNALINKGDGIVMENPTFPRAYNLFKSLKARVVACDIDRYGMDISRIKNPHIKLLYTTPSNQYPLGVKMSFERRLEILEWTARNNALVVEDDYDHEFSNWKNPVPSLFSLDKHSRVIYQGTFNKLLHPSLRLGYMIVPEYLKEPVKAVYEQSTRFIPSSTQEILSRFIEKDYLNKHLREVVKIAQERKQLFLDSTKESLAIETTDTGLHLIAKIKHSIKDTDAFKILLSKNVVAYPLSNYYIGKEKKEGLVMGYSSVNSKVIKEKTGLINDLL